MTTDKQDAPALAGAVWHGEYIGQPVAVKLDPDGRPFGWVYTGYEWIYATGETEAEVVRLYARDVQKSEREACETAVAHVRLTTYERGDEGWEALTLAEDRILARGGR